MSEFATPSKGYNVLKVAGSLTSVTIKCIIDERITVAPNMMYRSGKGRPHSHGTPVDVVPTTAGIPSTLNLLPRYCRELQTDSRSNITTVLLFTFISRDTLHNAVFAVVQRMSVHPSVTRRYCV